MDRQANMARDMAFWALGEVTMATENSARCRVTSPGPEQGSACRYLAGHEKAGIPHETRRGTWWHDSESLAALESILARATRA